MAYKVVNRLTSSPVTHTESECTMIWERKYQAREHAERLNRQYSVTHYHLDPVARTWDVFEATVPERVAAIKHGAFGQEYADTIGEGQSRAHIQNPGLIRKSHEMIVEHEMRSFLENYRG